MSESVNILVAAIGLVVFAGLLSSAEAAIAGLSRARAEQLLREGRAGARRLQTILVDPSKVLNTVLLLRVAAEISATVLVTALVSRWMGIKSTNFLSVNTILIATLVMILVAYVVIQVAPRTLGRQHAETVALWSASSLHLLAKLLGPIAQLLILLGNALTPGKGFSQGPFSSEAELREMVDFAQASELIEDDERQMIHSVFELGDTIVREVMVPRTEVIYIEQTKTLRQALSLLLRSGYSRIPVVGSGLDEILGFIFLKDVSKRIFDRQDAENTELVESLMRPVVQVPDTKPVDDLLREMQARRSHIAVAIDEYGGTAGLVTIEDILEEIVGEITDEFDDGTNQVTEVAAGVIRVPSRYLIDDLAELMQVDISDEDVDSVGGLMAKQLGVVPISGSTVELAGLRLTAEASQGRRNRISSILISRLTNPEESDE